MPFLAYGMGRENESEELVVPEEVSDGVDVECPGCGGRMRPRGGGPGQRARHFFHVDAMGGAESCTGVGKSIGESERHRVMKSLAVSGLRERFADVEIERCGTEIPLDVSASQGSQSDRRADALIEFASKNRYFGDGVIVEVQHANESKNIPQVTADYLDANFSIMWASEENFTADEFRLADFDQSFGADDRNAFSPYQHSSTDVWSLFIPSQWFSTPEGWQFDDPNEDCSHEFEYAGSDVRCILCGTHYKLHKESHFPMFSPHEGRRHWRDGPITVNGEETGIEPTGQPHVHRWRIENRGKTSIYSCSSGWCTAKKLSTGSETVIDYESPTVEQMETHRMKHCDHEWRRTGDGDRCWMCGKLKPSDGHQLY